MCLSVFSNYGDIFRANHRSVSYSQFFLHFLGFYLCFFTFAFYLCFERWQEYYCNEIAFFCSWRTRNYYYRYAFRTWWVSVVQISTGLHIKSACLIMVLSSAIIRDRGYINENENAVRFSVMCSNTIVLSIQDGPKKQATTKWSKIVLNRIKASQWD